MSIMRCDECGAFVDTDYYVEGFIDMETDGREAFLCSNCLDDWITSDEYEAWTERQEQLQ